MKRSCLSGSVRVWFLLSLSGCLSAIAISPGSAEVKSGNQNQEVQSQGNFKPLLTRKIRQLSEVERPSTSARLLVQSPIPEAAPISQVVQVTAVKANPTEKGVELILQTTQGEQLQITNRSADKNFIADIPNAQLRLPNGDAFTFSSQNPLEGITEITVTNLDANTIRVTVVGEPGLPTVELFDSDEGLIFGLTSAATAMQPPQQPKPEQPTSDTPQEEPTAQQDEPIELVVTGEQDGYRVRDSSSATKTDTPLRDIPQSIQVVPRQVLTDQQVTNLREALRNVPGVSQGSNPSGRGAFDLPVIRGFSAGSDILRNGLKDPTNQYIGFEAAGLERIEVLKGPASVLFGQGSLGGVVNYVTKQPLREPYYSLEASAGNLNSYRGAFDFSGPLNDSKTVLYRLNAAASTTESFFDFYDEQKYFVAPVFSWQISDRTKLTVQTEYLNRIKDYGQQGLPAVGTVLPNPNGTIPRNRNISELYSADDLRAIRVGYDFEHRFSENWQIRNAFGSSWIRRDRENHVFATTLAADNRTLNRNSLQGGDDVRFFNLDTYVIGNFATGSIQHQLVTGFNLTRSESDLQFTFRQAAAIDLFNPVYNQPLGPITSISESSTLTDTLGVYVQDQMALTENLKLLLGLRFDTFEQTEENRIANTEQKQSDNAFSPRVGIVYQPVTPISLYASYSRSFNPVIGNSFDGNQFQPERGTQYEVGIKADLNERLSATLAFYDLTRSNVSTTDNRPGVPPGFSIQTGEQRSRGIELSIAGEVLPGWNIITGYAYTDAEITQDNNTLLVGNQLNNVPQHTFNVWTTYELQSGNLQGLGFGLGFFFVDNQQGDLGNTFELPSYLTTDAAIFYKREQFRVALNIKNLFDVDYFEAASGRLGVFPGAPFTVQGTVSWQF